MEGVEEESRVSFPLYENFSYVSRVHVSQKTALVADMCFNRRVITVKKKNNLNTQCMLFSYILILFALTLTR